LGSGQERKYGADGRPEYDIDSDHNHVTMAVGTQAKGLSIGPEKTMSEIVYLILGQPNKAALLKFVPNTPVWLEECLVSNLEIAWPLNFSEFDLTTFPRRVNESDSELVGRIIYSLDQHFDEFSQTTPYTEVSVLGVSLGELKFNENFERVGFVKFTETPFGFRAFKNRSK
jgi:hypothetical protein